MAVFTTNTTVTVSTLTTLAKTLLSHLAALRPTPKSPEDHLAAQQRRTEARARVDTLLR
ncbi:hypothetical protein [Hasllibacter sp. MH4015]|uniref:hypothetical protein n=1 Tax=Hasllibacter sp. MH4015 TaxID=2854029 RepID=UPI001CD37BE7|nr:hypothetical protein [Hasllibacter sp. MH4015]